MAVGRDMSEAEFSNPESFLGMIARTLRDRPEWLHYALTGISTGMERARRQDREHHAQVELALACALTLADKKRLSPETIMIMQRQIVKALPVEGASPAEMKAFALYYEAVFGRKPEKA